MLIKRKTMVTEFDVYCAFRRAQANASGRGFRIPKDWKSFSEKMNKHNGECLYKMTMYFNTTYQNVDLDGYMTCGFELWKGFTYKHFCDNRIIEAYIQKDKIKKRKLNASKEEIEKSFEFISKELEGRPVRKGYRQLQNYCKFRDGEIKSIINTYNRGNVDMLTLTYCIRMKYVVLSDDERAMVPYISQRYRELLENLEPVWDFVREKENELDEKTRGQAVS